MESKNSPFPDSSFPDQGSSKNLLRSGSAAFSNYPFLVGIEDHQCCDGGESLKRGVKPPR